MFVHAHVGTMYEYILVDIRAFNYRRRHIGTGAIYDRSHLIAILLAAITGTIKFTDI